MCLRCRRRRSEGGGGVLVIVGSISLAVAVGAFVFK